MSPVSATDTLLNKDETHDATAHVIQKGQPIVRQSAIVHRTHSSDENLHAPARADRQSICSPWTTFILITITLSLYGYAAIVAPPRLHHLSSSSKEKAPGAQPTATVAWRHWYPGRETRLHAALARHRLHAVDTDPQQPSETTRPASVTSPFVQQPVSFRPGALPPAETPPAAQQTTTRQPVGQQPSAPRSTRRHPSVWIFS